MGGDVAGNIMLLAVSSLALFGAMGYLLKHRTVVQS
jgi:hypothetical protein